MNTQNSFPADNDMEARLWEYIDGLAPDTERTLIEKLITENADWRTRYSELMEVHKLIHSSELEEPSLRFTKNVMEEIARYHVSPAAKKYINNKVVWGIGFFFIAMIIGFIVYGVAQIDWSVAGDSKTTLGVDFNKVDYSKMFDSTYMNVFMMLNIILGLILLDRFLSNRNKKLLNQPDVQ